MECIDLKKLCENKRWRVLMDESFKAEQDADTRRERAWYYEIHGTGKGKVTARIHAHDGERLAVTSATQTGRKILKLEGSEMHQHGDLEMTVLFDPKHLDTVATMIRARHRRQLSDEALAKLAEARKKGFAGLQRRYQAEQRAAKASEKLTVTVK